MRFGLQRDDTFDVFHPEIVARTLIGGRELLHNRSFGEGHVVLVSRDNLVPILLRRLLDEAEERRLHHLSVDDKLSSEDLVAAVFRVDLRETEDFRVGQRPSVLLFQLVQIGHFVLAEGQSFLLVVLLQVVHILDGLRLVVYGEDVLAQTVVHALQHGVVFGLLRLHGEVLFYTRNAVKTHVLSNLNGIRTPGSDHFAAWSHEESIQRLGFFGRSVAVKPAKFVDFIQVRLMVDLCRNHGLGGSSKEKNHV